MNRNDRKPRPRVAYKLSAEKAAAIRARFAGKHGLPRTRANYDTVAVEFGISRWSVARTLPRLGRHRRAPVLGPNGERSPYSKLFDAWRVVPLEGGQWEVQPCS